MKTSNLVDLVSDFAETRWSSLRARGGRLDLRAPRVLHVRASEVTRGENVHCFAFVRSDPGYPAAVAGASLVGSIVLRPAAPSQKG